MVRATDRPAMTIAVDLGRKATKQKVTKTEPTDHAPGKFSKFCYLILDTICTIESISSPLVCLWEGGTEGFTTVVDLCANTLLPVSFHNR